MFFYILKQEELKKKFKIYNVDKSHSICKDHNRSVSDQYLNIVF